MQLLKGIEAVEKISSWISYQNDQKVVAIIFKIIHVEQTSIEIGYIMQITYVAKCSSEAKKYEVKKSILHI